MTYCVEELTMTGNKKDIDILEDIFRVKVPLSYLNPSSTPLSEMINDREAQIINGDTPSESIDQYPKSHIWIDHIGGAYSMAVSDVERIDEKTLVVSFSTPVVPPRTLVVCLGQVFDKVMSDMNFLEPEVGFQGGFLVEKRKVVEDIIEALELGEGHGG